MERHKPPIIVISGAIGSGKGTIVHALVNEVDLTWVPTHTTRPMRTEDPILSQRHYDTEATFLRHLARGEFLEAIELAGHRYGLLKEDLDKELRHGRPVVIEMSVDGGVKVARHYPHVFLIFLTTSEDIRRERIRHRGMNKQEIEARMKEARHEEKLAKEHYDYLIENREDNPNEAIEAVKKLIFERFPELEKK